MLLAEEQYILLIDVSIQDRAQQLQIYKIFNLKYHMVICQQGTKLMTNI